MKGSTVGYGLKQGGLNLLLNFKHIFTFHFKQLSNITQTGVLSPSPLYQYALANGVNTIA